MMQKKPLAAPAINPLRRRLQLLIGLAASGVARPPLLAASPANFARVQAGSKPLFPRDHGAHPNYRTEWWYLTAVLDSRDGPLGMQLTFFRTRTRFGRHNTSRFAPRQILFAHAAISLPKTTRILHAQQTARVDGPLTRYSETDTLLSITGFDQPWSLTRQANDDYRAIASNPAFGLSVIAHPGHAPVLQGDNGYSSKSESTQQASHYYSRPQLTVAGSVRVGTRHLDVTGSGWLDHEWSSSLLSEHAIGWDWIGLNFDSGQSLMAFQIRQRSGRQAFTEARWINDGHTGERQSVSFKTDRLWLSPESGVRYPIEITVSVGESTKLYLSPLLDNQEIDARASVGSRYWEGAVFVFDDADRKRRIGRGYLELTGYGEPLRL